MSVADGMRKMLALGIPMDEALSIVEAFEIPVTDARKERNRRYYEAHKPVLKRLNSDAHTEKGDRLKASEKRLNSDAAPRAHVEDKSLLTEIEPQEVRKKDKGAASPRDELLTVLDADHAGWVIDHRQRLRKPLTARAAHQLAAKLGACPDPNAAADLMIEKGWQSIEVDWLGPGTARGSPGRQREPTAGDIFSEMSKRIEDGIANGRTETGSVAPDEHHLRLVSRSPKH